jgi:ABC-type lipoprotein release transport system permease subunit
MLLKNQPRVPASYLSLKFITAGNLLPKDLLRVAWYYLTIAIKDSWRARTTLLTTATVFAGICLLLLVLGGLKRGLVQKLHDDIMKSPLTIKGDWYASSKNQAMDISSEAELLEQLPPGAVIIPEITKLVTISSGTASVEQVTLQATVPNDPFISYYGTAISSETASDLVVSPAVAQELGISVESLRAGIHAATISLKRGEGDAAVTAKLDVSICSIVGSESGKSKIAYISRHFMDQLEDFTQGEAVTEHGWPGLPIEDSLGYHGYLAFAKQEYTGNDTNRLHLRGLKATAITNTDKDSDDSMWRELYGMLQPHNLHVYFITSEAQNEAFELYVSFGVNEIEDITPSDDVMLYWSKPTTVNIGNTSHVMVGISGSLRWLRGYFYDLNTRLDGEEMNRVLLPFTEGEGNAELTLTEATSLRLTRVATPDTVAAINASKLAPAADAFVQQLVDLSSEFDAFWPRVVGYFDLTEAWGNSEVRSTLAAIDEQLNENRQRIAIVPPRLLSAVQRYRQGSLAFDSINGSFQRVSSPNYYFSGRFYARVLEDVPVIDDHLQMLGYSTVSSRLRVIEMQSYAGTLDLLVVTLQIIAIVLGVITSSVIFMEVTRRRQTSIGIMRIMGMKSHGIFLFVFARAILIAGLGWVLASVMAWLITMGLPLVANAECRLTVSDFAVVLLGAIVCSALGVAYHAYAATKLDPMTAINSGKVQ